MRDHFRFGSLLNVNEFECRFHGKQEKGKYVTATLFSSPFVPSKRFESDYMSGVAALKRAVATHLPNHKLMLFLNNAAYNEVFAVHRTSSQVISHDLNDLCLCVVREKNWENFHRPVLRIVTLESNLNVLKKLLATFHDQIKAKPHYEIKDRRLFVYVDIEHDTDDQKLLDTIKDKISNAEVSITAKTWYLPTVYRYLPVIQPETFSFVESFVALDLDGCFTENFSTVIQKWYETNKPLFMVKWTGYKREWHDDVPIVPLGGAVGFKMQEKWDHRNDVLAKINKDGYRHGIDERVLQIIFNSAPEENIYTYISGTPEFAEDTVLEILKRSRLSLSKANRRGEVKLRILQLIWETLCYKWVHKIDVAEHYLGLSQTFIFKDARNGPHYLEVFHKELKKMTRRNFSLDALCLVENFTLKQEPLKMPLAGFLDSEAATYLESLNTQSNDLSERFVNSLINRPEEYKQAVLMQVIERSVTDFIIENWKRRSIITLIVLKKILNFTDETDQDEVKLLSSFLTSANGGESDWTIRLGEETILIPIERVAKT